MSKIWFRIRTYLCVSPVASILFHFQQNTLQEGVDQLDRAFDEYGINFLDTAEMHPVPMKGETQGATDKALNLFLKDVDGKMSFWPRKCVGGRPSSRGFLVVMRVQLWH
jgi:hypothetical protein